MDIEPALEQCQTILDLLDEVPESAHDAASDFFRSVEEKVTGIGGWIEEKQRVTDKMVDALDNMEAGVRKWLRPRE